MTFGRRTEEFGHHFAVFIVGFAISMRLAAVVGDFAWSFQSSWLDARTKRPSIGRLASSWYGRSIECLPIAGSTCLRSRTGSLHTTMGTSCPLLAIHQNVTRLCLARVRGYLRVQESFIAAYLAK